MSTAPPSRTDGAGDTRGRLIEVAIDLFTRHSFAGTSLQMIADELGFTKAAIYHHFRTREQLLDAVIGPIQDRLREVIEEAEGLRGTHARADHLLTGFAELAVSHRAVPVLAADPAVALLLRANSDWNDLIERQLALLSVDEPAPAGAVRASVVLAGIAGASGPAFDELDRDELRDQLIATGRRALGLRTPRSPARTRKEQH